MKNFHITKKVLIQKSALEDPNFCLTPVLSEMLVLPHITMKNKE
jgi:hypothetical protein